MDSTITIPAREISHSLVGRIVQFRAKHLGRQSRNIIAEFMQLQAEVRAIPSATLREELLVLLYDLTLDI